MNMGAVADVPMIIVSRLAVLLLESLNFPPGHLNIQREDNGG